MCLAGLFLLLGCAQPVRRADAPAARASAAAPQAKPSAPSPQGRDAACAQDGDCGAGSLCLKGVCTPTSSALAACQEHRVHFDFDSTAISESERPVLARLAQCLRGAGGTHVTIEGHTDERGTQEYNLALGERRAKSIAAYLALHGVAEDRLRAVTYGKEQPLCADDDDPCHARNRRAQVRTAGVQSRM